MMKYKVRGSLYILLVQGVAVDSRCSLQVGMATAQHFFNGCSQPYTQHLAPSVGRHHLLLLPLLHGPTQPETPLISFHTKNELCGGQTLVFGVGRKSHERGVYMPSPKDSCLAPAVLKCSRLCSLINVWEEPVSRTAMQGKVAVVARPL